MEVHIAIAEREPIIGSGGEALGQGVMGRRPLKLMAFLYLNAHLVSSYRDILRCCSLFAARI